MSLNPPKVPHPCFLDLFPPIPLLTILPNYSMFDADVVQSVVKRSDDTHEFCKLTGPRIKSELTLQTDRQVSYYKTVSLPTPPFLSKN